MLALVSLPWFHGCAAFSLTGVREEAASWSSQWFQSLPNLGGDDVVMKVPEFTLVIHVEGNADLSFAGVTFNNRIELIGRRTKDGIILDPVVTGFELVNYLAMHNSRIMMAEHWQENGL